MSLPTFSVFHKRFTPPGLRPLVNRFSKVVYRGYDVYRSLLIAGLPSPATSALAEAAALTIFSFVVD